MTLSASATCERARRAAPGLAACGGSVLRAALPGHAQQCGRGAFRTCPGIRQQSYDRARVAFDSEAMRLDACVEPAVDGRSTDARNDPHRGVTHPDAGDVGGASR